MEKISVKVEDKTYIVSVAQTEEEKEKGLMGVETLPENEGMLFDYTDNPQTEISFWMKDTLIPLDIIFINNQGIVAAVTQGEPMSEEQLTCVADEGELIFYVLEVNVNSGIKEGDRFEMSQEKAEELGLVDENGRPIDEDEEVSDEELEMFLIGPDGQPVHKIEPGCRIFSRIHTKTLIKLAKKANKSKLDSDYKKLGKKMFEMIHTQDTQEAEYVEAPEKKQGE
jgi:uncharacterized membrane protein (UPF0127 family)